MNSKWRQFWAIHIQVSSAEDCPCSQNSFRSFTSGDHSGNHQCHHSSASSRYHLLASVQKELGTSFFFHSILHWILTHQIMIIYSYLCLSHWPVSFILLVETIVICSSQQNTRANYMFCKYSLNK